MLFLSVKLIFLVCLCGIYAARSRNEHYNTDSFDINSNNHKHSDDFHRISTSNFGHREREFDSYKKNNHNRDDRSNNKNSNKKPKASSSNNNNKTETIPMLDNRIVGGLDADITDYPYQVSLQYRRSHVCGGAIVSSKIIITAAHCTHGLRARDLHVRVGSTESKSGGQLLDVSRVIEHPQFDPITIDYDMAILELSSKITHPKAKTIKLPNENYILRTDKSGTVTGWGTLNEGGKASTSLQVVHLPAVALTRCKGKYEHKITTRMFCAGFDEGGRDSCQGDSGGPYVVDGKLIGVVSWGHGCARPDYPGIYANVAAFRSFINENTGI